MDKAEALALLGRQVQAWTASNGIYVGELVQVLPTRPWRAQVRVCGVISAAQHFEFARGACRRGFRVGEVVEVGHSSIKPALGPAGTDYLGALQRALSDNERWYAENQQGPHAAAHKGAADALRLVIKAEQLRLQTGEWHLKS